MCRISTYRLLKGTCFHIISDHNVDDNHIFACLLIFIDNTIHQMFTKNEKITKLMVIGESQFVKQNLTRLFRNCHL